MTNICICSTPVVFTGVYTITQPRSRVERRYAGTLEKSEEKKKKGSRVRRVDLVYVEEPDRYHVDVPLPVQHTVQCTRMDIQPPGEPTFIGLGLGFK